MPGLYASEKKAAPKAGLYASEKAAAAEKPKGLYAKDKKKVIDIGKPTLQAVNWALEQLNAPIQGITEGLVGPTIRHGANLFTGRESLADVAADLPNAPRHLLEGLRASIPPALPWRRPFTGPQNISEEMQAAGLDKPSADVLSLGLEIPIGGKALNIMGAKALLPAGRAVANAEIGRFRTRAIPGIKGTLETFGPSGVTLPNKYRDAYYKILREEEGRTDWRAFMRERNLKAGLKLPKEAQDAITDALETKTIDRLPDALQGMAKAIQTENRNMIADALRANLEDVRLKSKDLGYAARVLNREGRAAEGLKKRYGFREAGLSTYLGKERTEAGRALTTAEMGLIGKVEPIVKGTLMKGAATDRSVMHARIITRLDREFGRPAAQGKISTAKLLEGSRSGLTAQFENRLKGRTLPPELHDAVRQLNRSMQPEEWGRTSEVIRTINNEFRRWALFSPGFISRNMQNNVAQNVIAGNHDPATWAGAFALRWRLARNKLTPGDMAKIEGYIKNGVIGKGQVSLETAKGTGGWYGRLFNRWRNLNFFAEDVSRIALNDHFVNRGKGAAEAGRLVNVWLFNYSPSFKSRTFTSLRKTAFPFINWKSNVPGLFVRATLERPGSFGQIGNIRSKLNAYAPPDQLAQLPEYQQEQGATYNPITKKYELPQGIGQFDLNQMANDLRKGPEGWARLGITNAYPQYGLAAGEAAQKSFFLNRPYEYGPGRAGYTTARAFLKFFPKEFLKEHGVVVKEDGTVLAPVRMALWLGAFPQKRLADIAADFIKPDPNSEYRIRSFLLGLRSVAPPDSTRRSLGGN